MPIRQDLRFVFLGILTVISGTLFNQYAEASSLCSASFYEHHVSNLEKALNNYGTIFYEYPYLLVYAEPSLEKTTVIASDFTPRKLFVEVFSKVKKGFFNRSSKNYLYSRSRIKVSDSDTYIYSLLFGNKETDAELYVNHLNAYMKSEWGYNFERPYETLLQSYIAANTDLLEKADTEMISKFRAELDIGFLEISLMIAESPLFLQRLQETIDFFKISKEELLSVLDGGFLERTIDLDGVHEQRVEVFREVYDALTHSKRPEHIITAKKLRDYLERLNYYPRR